MDIKCSIFLNNKPPKIQCLSAIDLSHGSVGSVGLVGQFSLGFSHAFVVRCKLLGLKSFESSNGLKVKVTSLLKYLTSSQSGWHNWRLAKYLFSSTWPFHVVSVGFLAAFQSWGSQSSYMVTAFSYSEVAKGLGRTCASSQGLTFQVPERRFCCIQLVKQVTKARRDSRTRE